MNNMRHKFEIPHDISYLNQAYMSPQMTLISDIGKAALVKKNLPWTLSVDDFFNDSEAIRSEFAKIIDATADDIAIIPSVSYGISIAAKNVALDKGDEIILLAEQFPSNVYSWIEVAKEKEAKVVFVEKADHSTWTESILSAINAKTKVISVPNVHWTNGAVIDLKTISAACEKGDISLVVDATQSLGAMSFSIDEIKADFVVVAGYKWLIGPYSLGYMYVSEKYHQGKPIEFNWINKEKSEEFAGLVNYKDNFQKGARRYDVGERSNFALLPMGLAALKQVNTWTVNEISNYISPILERIANEAEKVGFKATDKAERAAHMMGISMTSEKALEMFKCLKDKNVFVSIRGNSIRISPYVYTTKTDVDTFLNVLTSS